MAVFKCSQCEIFQCLSLRALLNHIYSVHSNDLNFKILCNVNDCPVSFTKYNSLYKHVLKHHRQVYDNDVITTDSDCVTTVSDNCKQTQENGNGSVLETTKDSDRELSAAEQEEINDQEEDENVDIIVSVLWFNIFVRGFFY